MNVLFANISEKTGGAAIAAGRIAAVLKKQRVVCNTLFPQRISQMASIGTGQDQI